MPTRPSPASIPRLGISVSIMSRVRLTIRVGLKDKGRGRVSHLGKAQGIADGMRLSSSQKSGWYRERVVVGV